MKYLLVSAGCAECVMGSSPLMVANLYDSLEAAKADSWLQGREWKDHPQGGWYASSGQGDDWIFEVSSEFTLKITAEEVIT